MNEEGDKVDNVLHNDDVHLIIILNYIKITYILTIWFVYNWMKITSIQKSQNQTAI